MTNECTVALNSQINIKYRQGHTMIPANTGKEPLSTRMCRYLHYLRFYLHQEVHYK